jgi:hypothetical protein
MNEKSYLDPVTDEQLRAAIALVDADEDWTLFWGPEGPPKDTWRAALSRLLLRLSAYLDRA